MQIGTILVANEVKHNLGSIVKATTYIFHWCGGSLFGTLHEPWTFLATSLASLEDDGGIHLHFRTRLKSLQVEIGHV